MPRGLWCWLPEEGCVSRCELVCRLARMGLIVCVMCESVGSFVLAYTVRAGINLLLLLMRTFRKRYVRKR